jgi:hypothetical protein
MIAQPSLPTDAARLLKREIDSLFSTVKLHFERGLDVVSLEDELGIRTPCPAKLA